MIKLRIGSVYIPIKTSIFPGGEVYVKIEDPEPYMPQGCVIEANIHSSDDVMILLNLVDAVKRMYGPDVEITLFMPYIPYARQDRVCQEGESFSLKIFCDMINSCNFYAVAVLDPHSDVATALINRCVVIEQQDLVEKINLDRDNTILVSPDAGANKKTFKVAQKCGFKTVYRADKIRDLQTGKIVETVVYGEKTDKDFLIVDDICDGGTTFIELAKKLKELTTGEIYLYTTHAILSKGLFPLMRNIKHLYTANPWCENVNEDYITVINY